MTDWNKKYSLVELFDSKKNYEKGDKLDFKNPMIKARVHIQSENIFMDKNLFIDVMLPGIPRIGETLFIGWENKNKLAEMAGKKIEIAENYLEWFYGNSSNIEEVKKENLEDLSFADANTVTHIAYEANSNIIDIEIGRGIE